MLSYSFKLVTFSGELFPYCFVLEAFVPRKPQCSSLMHCYEEKFDVLDGLPGLLKVYEIVLEGLHMASNNRSSISSFLGSRRGGI